jgi:hypothetical protein
VFKASSPSPSDLPPGWTASEFERYKDHMGDNWLPPPEIGHNGPPKPLPATDPAPALSVVDPVRLHIVSAEYIRRAIRDDELDRGHLKVLANLWERFNSITLTAWPSRELLAEEEDLDPKSATNKLYDLRRKGYIDWGRMQDPKKPERTLLHYWWLQDEITVAVQALREKAARPTGQKNYPPERAKVLPARTGTRPSGKSFARQGGNKELLEEGRGGPETGATPQGEATVAGLNGKNNTKAAMAAAVGGQTAYAHRNIVIAPSGKISLGEEFRAELRETYTDNQIERGLERAPSQAGSADPVKLLNQIRRCCSYAKQDDAKSGKLTAVNAHTAALRRLERM